MMRDELSFSQENDVKWRKLPTIDSMYAIMTDIKEFFPSIIKVLENLMMVLGNYNSDWVYYSWDWKYGLIFCFDFFYVGES